MYLLFIDESGTPPGPADVAAPYFVIGAIAVPEGSWHRLRDALLGLKARRGIRGELKWRYFAPGNDDVRNPLRTLGRDERDSVRSEVYRAICADKSLRTFAAVCSPKSAYRLPSVTEREDVYRLGYKAVLERFQYHLQDRSVPGHKALGIVVADHRGARDDMRLRAHHQKLLHSGAEFNSRYRNVVEGLFLEPSNLSVGIQIADMVAGAVWRAFEKQDRRWFDMLAPSIRRGPAGETDGYGIVKVPKAGWE